MIHFCTETFQNELIMKRFRIVLPKQETGGTKVHCMTEPWQKENMSARTHISKYAYADACISNYAYDEARYVYTQTSMHSINHTLNPQILVNNITIVTYVT